MFQAACVACALVFSAEVARANNPVVIVVTTTVDEDDGTSDPGVGTGTSLREAINRANTDGVNSEIVFNEAVFAAPRKTITLNGTPLPTLVADGPLFNRTLLIQAPPAGVEISGNNTSRIFSLNEFAQVTMRGLTLRNGNAQGGSGGAIHNWGLLLLDSCTLESNSAGQGGAIYSATGYSYPLTLRNCTLSGNTSTSWGGAIFNDGGEAFIESCTITQNTAPSGQGGGLAAYGGIGNLTQVVNSIIAGNHGTDVDSVLNDYITIVSTGYNLVGDGNAITGIFNQTGDVIGNTDPGLAPLADNGGRTKTHALLATSPARDTGNTPLTVDQRGVARPQPAPHLDDKGAFEFNAFNESLVVTTLADEEDGTSDPAWGTGTSLREAIKYANTDGVNSVITFSESVFAAPRKTITLTGQLLVQSNGTLSITAPAAGVEISGNNSSRVFELATGADVTLTRLTLRNGNSGLGGAIFNIGGTLLVDACTLSGNNGGDGGAIFTQSATTRLRNSTLTGNQASSSGGAVFNAGGGLALIESCTITSNTAPAGRGGGIASSGSPTARTVVGNSIISGNAGSDLDFVSGTSGSDNTFRSDGYNLIGLGNAISEFAALGDVIANTNPGLAPLADNGGPTRTHALLGTSPAVDTGNTTLANDQRGVARPQSGAHDKGAFDSGAFPGRIVVTTLADEDNGTANPNVGTGTSLREAINAANTDGLNSIITFSESVFAAPRKTIILTNGQLALHNNGTLAITAPIAGLAISGNNASRVFQVTPDATVTLSGLTIRDGNGLGGGLGGGGGIINDRGTLLLEGCTLTANQTAEGGALHSKTDLSGKTTTLRNCTLSGNTATFMGGAIYNTEGRTILESCTITSNTAPANGGSAVLSLGTALTRTEVKNSILAGNANTDVDFVFGTTNSFQSAGYNLIGDGNGAGAFNQTGDAVIGNGSAGLSALQDNGGRTFTHAVLLGSPALNTGQSSLGADQRGLLRVHGTAADKGAYELQPELYTFWAGYTFPANSPADQRAIGADPDGDNIPNGIEQGTGRNPLVFDATPTVVPIGLQGPNFVLEFHRSVLVDPNKFRVQYTFDLQSWRVVGISYQNLGTVGATTERIRALVPTFVHQPQTFGRLIYTP